ncbi:tetratricopeptide repeat protein [Heliorestis convoluta]|uniref:Tetratricopeptide repeat protein n=1 Tax=Heliorestis convoluta TaxID=356322 RepID=A0A5Q2MYN7_9FIRM|nr:hypothetical protein [Heliorestis convoluta]QGG48054.1 tetratricopeptide repeat protein [Heliorestis convoluta]
MVEKFTTQKINEVKKLNVDKKIKNKEHKEVVDSYCINEKYAIKNLECFLYSFYSLVEEHKYAEYCEKAIAIIKELDCLYNKEDFSSYEIDKKKNLQIKELFFINVLDKDEFDHWLRKIILKYNLAEKNEEFDIVLKDCDYVLQRFEPLANKDKSSILQYKGKILNKKGSYKQALDNLNSALKLFPNKNVEVDIANALYSISIEKVKTGDLEEAFEYSLNVLELDGFYNWTVFHEQCNNVKNIISLLYEKYADSKQIFQMQRIFLKLVEFLEKNHTNPTQIKKQFNICFEDKHKPPFLKGNSVKEIFLYDMKIKELINIYVKLNMEEKIKEIFKEISSSKLEKTIPTYYYFECLDTAIEIDPVNYTYYISLKVKSYQEKIFNCYEEIIRKFNIYNDEILDKYNEEVLMREKELQSKRQLTNLIDIWLLMKVNFLTKTVMILT